MQNTGLLQGNIFWSLNRFALPMLVSLLLQTLYGGVDLLIVGRFATTADVSGVSSGAMFMQMLTGMLAGLSNGVTILVGQLIGADRRREAGQATGTGIWLFGILSIVLTVLLLCFSGLAATWMDAPEDAFQQTRGYIFYCGAGTLFIVAFNFLSALFRAVGDSITPLKAVVIACVINIAGDLFLVKYCGMGAAGAAIATVFSQGCSVGIVLYLIRKRTLPMEFHRRDIKWNSVLLKKEFCLGFPLALQDLLVSFSFLTIQVIVNGMSLTGSAAVGIGDRLCGFIMLMPAAYSQALSAFVAQNIGAKQNQRIVKALVYGVAVSVSFGIVFCILCFLEGDWFSALFSNDTAVIQESFSYLKAYAIDCVLTPFLFCFLGYYTGCGHTTFVMIQGILSAFCIRIPVANFASRLAGATLFEIGLATPMSSVFQIILCLVLFRYLNKRTVYCFH